MCTKYKVCGYRHLEGWKVSKLRRDRKGRFDKDRRLWKYLLIGFGIYAVSLIGVNTIKNSLGKVFVVENTLAEVEWHQPTLREEVTIMLRDAGIDVGAALKIADYESWFQEDNYHVNTKGQYAGTIDRGLWMLSDYFYSDISDDCAYDGICATTQAIRIMKTRGFNEWTCYNKHLCR